MTAPASTAKPTTSALEAWRPQASALLDDYPEDKFNVLVPTVALRQVNPYLVPDIEVVKLSIDETKGEIYHDGQMKAGMYAPTAKGLAKIRQVAGIDEIASRRVDDGSDPNVVEWTVTIEMSLPSGQRVRAHGSKRVDLAAMSFASEAHRQRTRQFMLENAQTKALNRAIRSILSLHGSMPKAQLAKPFAILRWVPNMADPDVRRRMLDNLLPATTAAYGPENGANAQQLAAGEPIVAPPLDDDEATEGSFVDLGDGRQADTATGEVTTGGPEPDWFGTASTTPPTLVDRLRAKGASGSGDAASQQQNERLTGVLKQLAIAMPVVQAVIKKAFDVDPVTVEDENGKTVRRIPLTAGQVDALLELSTEDTFVVEFAKAADE